MIKQIKDYRFRLGGSGKKGFDQVEPKSFRLGGSAKKGYNQVNLINTNQNMEKQNFVEKVFAVSYMIKGALAAGEDLDYVKENSIFCDAKVFREAVCKGTDMKNVRYITEDALQKYNNYIVNGGSIKGLLVMGRHKKVGILGGIEHIIPVCYLLDIFWNIIEINYKQSNLKNIIEQEYDNWVQEAFITKTENDKLTSLGIGNKMPIKKPPLPNMGERFSRYQTAGIHLYEIDWQKSSASNQLVLGNNGMPII